MTGIAPTHHPTKMFDIFPISLPDTRIPDGPATVVVTRTLAYRRKHMRQHQPLLDARVFDARVIGAMALIGGLFYAATAVRAESPTSSDSVGRIDFEAANLPPANVELDLSQNMFSSVFGISDAAIAGVAETLAKAAKGEHAEGTKLAADQLAAARQVVGLVGKVVHEVRVRAYEKSADDLFSRLEKQLSSDNWERVALARKGNESARVYAIYRDNAIRGVFIIASKHDGQALVNVVCDLSPDNVKSLTAAVTKIGLDNGLQQQIEMKMRRMHGPAGPPGPASPAPPRPPR